MLFTNTSSTTVATTTAAQSTALWMRLWFEIFEPDIAVFGVIANAIIFIIMPRREVLVGASTKIYYISIAISDCVNLINSWLLDAGANDSL